jgi:hypothetical protein
MASSDTFFLCTCNERLKTTDDVDAHDKSWLALGHNMQCQFPGCMKPFTQTSNAKRHWRTHLPERLGKYFCSKCDASYVKPGALRNHEAAVDCRKNRKRCRSVFEEVPALAAPSKAPRNDASSPDGHAVESEPSSEAPSNDTSQPQTFTASSPTMAVQHPIQSQSSLLASTQDLWTLSPQVEQVEQRVDPPLLESPQQTSIKTTSPMDALLDLTDTDQLALFQSHTFMRIDDCSRLLAEWDNRGVISSLGSKVPCSMSASSDFKAEMDERLSSSFRESMSDNPGPPSLKRGSRRVQRPDGMRVNVCDGCFRGSIVLNSSERHERQRNGLKAHKNRDSGTDSGAASVSSRSSALPRLEHTPVPPSQYHENHFTIDRSQEFDLQRNLRTQRTGLVPLRFCVTLTGSWDSEGSLLIDIPKSIRSRLAEDRESHITGLMNAHLWTAITKFVATKPPGMLKKMFDLHILSTAIKYESIWLIDLEWTEEGIAGRWKICADPANIGPASGFNSISVVELPLLR